jgi:hypothetical protein
MKIQMHRLGLKHVPVDLFADPDGNWTYESLVLAAGRDPNEHPAPVVAALAEPWCGHPAGAAVIVTDADGGSVIAVIECDAVQERAA